MNDTKSRLRDYLNAKADTVSNADHGPGLELDVASTSARRSWMPMALAAASIGAVLILAVTFLSSLGGNQPEPAAQLLTGPVSTAAPKIPYTTLVHNNPDNPLDTWWAVLHDGKQQVKNPGAKGQVLSRLGDGWLVMTGYPDPKKSQPALLTADGKLEPLGPVGSISPVVSPDGKQIAVSVAPFGDKTSRIVVVNVEDGKEAAAITLQSPNLGPLGWNKDGIWIHLSTFEPGQPVSVWQPGSAEPRALGKVAGNLTVGRGVDTVVQLAFKDNKGCFRVGPLGANGLELKHNYCPDNGIRAIFVGISPDGRTVAFSHGAALDVATGKVTKLRLPAGYQGSMKPIFEDPANVILAGESTAKNAAPKVIRCGVATGECKVLVTVDGADTLDALVSP
ncbi:hypothetical protein AB0P21_08675 [Kribbella sp. NPDC056861]|uniref:hypothetical protein n=1 Tax=Kribbella sp. NPDC056861 TaxID=3154857 RepID=UPI003416AA5C